jgi:hypothetical protein
MTKLKLAIYLLLTTIIYLYAVVCGLGLTPDSHAYMAAAKSFAISHQFNSTNGEPYTAWTPLYPFLLSFYTDNIVIFAIILQGIGLLTVVAIIYYSTEKLIENHFLCIWVCLQAVFSPYLFLVSSFLWSEIVFTAILWILLSVFFQGNKNNKFHYFLWLIVLSNLLCLQRNTGIFIVLSLGLCMLLQNLQDLTWQNLKILVSKTIICKIFGAIFYVIFSLLGVIIWHIRCEMLTPTKVNFTENIFDFPITHVLYFSLHRLSTWFFPPQIPYFLRIILLFVIIFYLLKELLKIYQVNKFNYFLAYLPIIIFSYIFAFIILLRNFDADGDRYLAPIHAVFVLWLGIFFDSKLKNGKNRLILFFLFMWLAYPIIRTVKNVQFWHEITCVIKKN